MRLQATGQERQTDAKHLVWPHPQGEEAAAAAAAGVAGGGGVGVGSGGALGGKSTSGKCVPAQQHGSTYVSLWVWDFFFMVTFGKLEILGVCVNKGISGFSEVCSEIVGVGTMCGRGNKWVCELWELGGNRWMSGWASVVKL